MLQNVNAAILLGAFYVLLFVPFALPFKLLWDLLEKRRGRGDSYWTPRENRLRDLESLRRQGLPRGTLARPAVPIGRRLFRGAILILYYPLLLLLVSEGLMRLTGARYATWYSAAEVAERSGVRVVLEADRLPAIDGALDLARKGVRTSGDPRNRDFAAAHVSADGLAETYDALGYDPQTAGGLLVSLPKDKGPSLEAAFEAKHLFLRRVGHVEEGAGVLVT